MKVLKKSSLLSFAIGLLVGITIGFALLVSIRSPKPLDLAHSQNWLVIREYHGVLDPAEGEVKARVSVISRWSGEGGGETVQQNKIEVTRNNKTAVFTWPDPKEYAGGRCEILDLDEDDRKEFVLFDSAHAVRVVSYSDGQFQFRQRADELISLESQTGPSDLSGDGHLEFISEEHFPESLEGKTIQIPHVMRWSLGKGFEDVSSKFPFYYTDRVLPVLREQLALEGDQKMRALYSDAIVYVESKLAPRS